MALSDHAALAVVPPVLLLMAVNPLVPPLKFSETNVTAEVVEAVKLIAVPAHIVVALALAVTAGCATFIAANTVFDTVVPQVLMAFTLYAAASVAANEEIVYEDDVAP